MVSTYVMVWIIVIGLVGLAVLWVMAGVHRQRKFSAREKLNLGDIYESEFADESVNESDFTDAWNLVAKAYRVDPEKLRVDDDFNQALGLLDRYNFGSGKEDLELVLRTDTDFSGYENITNVKQFIIYYSRHKKTNNSVRAN